MIRFLKSSSSLRPPLHLELFSLAFTYTHSLKFVLFIDWPQIGAECHTTCSPERPLAPRKPRLPKVEILKTQIQAFAKEWRGRVRKTKICSSDGRTNTR